MYVTNDHYLLRYLNFIEACIRTNQDLTDETYVEHHHILPKAMWPHLQSFKRNPWNKCTLTARQHYIAHHLLVKSFPKNRAMKYAFWGMSTNHKYKQCVSSRKYAWAREQQSVAARVNMKGNSWNAGKHRSIETREKISAILTGKQVSQETRIKISQTLKNQGPWNKGKRLSEEHKRRMSKSLKGKACSPEKRAKISASKKKKQYSLGIKNEVFTREVKRII